VHHIKVIIGALTF